MTLFTLGVWLYGAAQLLGGFPHETVPDGNILAPHHLYIGIGIMALTVASVWDDQDSDPLWTAVSVLVALFGFMYIWPIYPEVGAVATLVALCGLPLFVSLDWDVWRTHKRRLIPIGLGALIGLDDVLEHAFGVWTPLDRWFKEFIVPVITTVTL